ncbi:hypothetical protein ACF1B0_27320 [Streptomyces anandii]|uniref:hypothetical protein n=1 Tax=Streptomyces anandii TaxID=285454 RepID=UPI0036FA0DDF
MAIAAAVTVGVYGPSQVDAARGAEHKAQAEVKTLKNQPPKAVTKTVTKKVPTFGKSTLMGIFASGAIQQGTYDSAGNEVFTPNDSTCSDFYTSLTNQYTSIAIFCASVMSSFLGAVAYSLVCSVCLEWPPTLGESADSAASGARRAVGRNAAPDGQCTSDGGP